MSLSWTAPADVLTEGAEPGWAGIWTLTHAAARAALHLADALPLIDAQDKLEWARPASGAEEDPRAPAMTPATYPDLIAQATRLIEDGRRSTVIRMDDRNSALSVVTDRHAVLSPRSPRCGH